MEKLPIILLMVLTGCLASCKKAPEPAASPAPSDKKSTKVTTPEANKPAAAAQASGEKISFSSQVRPILSNSCFACHGPDAQNQSSPFRLDT
ncbi:hypothetical protein EBU02_13910, partial [bacterium]|nr:hypothetical protein [bacterium]